MTLSNPKGTQDFLPPNSEYKHYIESEFRKVVACYGFREIVTPTFEHTELFLRSTGLTTDIVTKQMYTFTDKGNRSLTLRPEGTPGVIRAILQNNLKLPARLFYIGPMFRYEKPQKGRFREFYQLGIEAVGEAGPTIDIEVIELGVKFFKAIKIENIITIINSVGCQVCRPKFRINLGQFLEEVKEKICDECKIRAERNPLRIFDCKEPVCQNIYQEAPKITDHLCYECQTHFQAILDELIKREIPFELNKMLVRGLDYYTRTAFEFVSSAQELGAQDSLGGGGRYDNLVEDFGGPKTPAIGFALGLERILLAIEPPTISSKLVYIIPLDADAQKKGKELINILRNAQIPAMLNVPEKNLRAGLGIADNLGCEYVIIIGANEMKKNVYTVKNLLQRTQQEVPQDEIVEFFKRKNIDSY